MFGPRPLLVTAFFFGPGIQYCKLQGSRYQLLSVRVTVGGGISYDEAWEEGGKKGGRRGGAGQRVR